MSNLTKYIRAFDNRYTRHFGDADVLENMSDLTWAYGGDWPIFDSSVTRSSIRQSKFFWPSSDTFESLPTDYDFRLFASNAPDTTNYVRDDNSGNKTAHMSDSLLDHLDVEDVIFVEPTIEAAQFSLMSLPSRKHRLRHGKRLARIGTSNYVSYSQLLHIIHDDLLTDSSIIVLSYYGHSSPIVNVLEKVLNTITNRIYCLYSNFENQFTASSDIKIVEYSDSSQLTSFLEYNLQLSYYEMADDVVVMGMLGSFCSPSHVIRRTNAKINASIVCDFGLRYDPIVNNETIIDAYRTATMNELNISLNILKSSDICNREFHYVKREPYLELSPLRLYSRIDQVLCSSFGVDNNKLSNEDIRKTLTCHKYFNFYSQLLSESHSKTTNSINVILESTSRSTESSSMLAIRKAIKPESHNIVDNVNVLKLNNQLTTNLYNKMVTFCNSTLKSTSLSVKTPTTLVTPKATELDPLNIMNNLDVSKLKLPFWLSNLSEPKVVIRALTLLLAGKVELKEQHFDIINFIFNLNCFTKHVQTMQPYVIMNDEMLDTSLNKTQNIQAIVLVMTWLFSTIVRKANINPKLVLTGLISKHELQEIVKEMNDLLHYIYRTNLKLRDDQNSMISTLLCHFLQHLKQNSLATINKKIVNLNDNIQSSHVFNKKTLKTTKNKIVTLEEECDILKDYIEYGEKSTTTAKYSNNKTNTDDVMIVVTLSTVVLLSGYLIYRSIHKRR